MENRIWYAVQEEPEDAWDWGSYDFDKAKDMLLLQGFGLIAEINTETGVCLKEYTYDELF